MNREEYPPLLATVKARAEAITPETFGFIVMSPPQKTAYHRAISYETVEVSFEDDWLTVESGDVKLYKHRLSNIKFIDNVFTADLPFNDSVPDKSSVKKFKQVLKDLRKEGFTRVADEIENRVLTDYDGDKYTPEEIFTNPVKKVKKIRFENPKFYGKRFNEARFLELEKW